MTLARRTGSFVALALALGCASDSVLLPPQGLKYAVAQATCGPADGPALLIFLTRNPTDGPSPEAPYVRIYISDATSVNGHALAVTGANAEANASFVTSDTPSKVVAEEARNGSVVAAHSTADNSIDGVVDLSFATAGHLSGRFKAPLFPNNALCL